MESDKKLIRGLREDWQTGGIEMERIKGHTTNRNWIVGYKGKKFFVRLPWERTDIVDREAEAKNILAISKSKRLVGVVPKFFLYIFRKKNILNPEKRIDFPDGTMIMEYIEGRDIKGKDLERSKIQKALLESLYSFHTSGVRFLNPYDVFRDEIKKYREKAKKYPIGKLLDKKEIEKIEKIERLAKDRLPLCGKISTHNDLIFTNLRLGRDKRIYILDFEYAGFNVRSGLYYDLGIILGGNLFYKEPITVEIFREILKKARKIYKRDLDNQKIYFGAVANVLVMFWWGAVKYFSSRTKGEKKYFEDYVLKRNKGVNFLFNIVEYKRGRGRD